MADMRTGTFSPEISRLSEKLQKDPNSKIFLNLAEEYFKGGMLEEALIVLQSGLKLFPTYLSAKVLLGRVYAAQNKIKDAREVFEQILKINPDNIIVNKKLASIYIEDRRYNDAEKCCNQVLFFNAKDAEALSLIQKIRESKIVPARPSVEASHVSEAPLENSALPRPSNITEDRIKTVEPAKSNAPSGSAEAPQAPAEAILDKNSDESLAKLNPISPEVPATSLLPQAAPETALPQMAGLEKTPSQISEPVAQPVESENSFDFSDIMKEEEVKPPASKVQPTDNGKGKIKENLETIALAELYIKQGFFDKGIEIYQKLLELDPFNETVRQQLQDAKTIGNLLGAKSPPEKIEKNILETILPPQEKSEPVPQAQPLTLNSKNQAKINRLKLWLETLKKSNN